MHVLIEEAIKTSDNRYTVLIYDDMGTGKEPLARAIHNSEQRRPYPLIPVNCSALPESLTESEFFSYEKGAFSGADCKGKRGLLEMADKGTLFLDEFGEASLSLQAKLLHVLQDGRVRRVDGAQIIPVSVRTTVTTNANLGEVVEQRLLRVDLYYHTNVLLLTIPPLRERPQDISLLTRHLVQEYTKEFQRWIILDEACFDALHHHTWPGNVYEPEDTIIRLMPMTKSDVIIREGLGMVNLPAIKRGPIERPFKEQVLYAKYQLIEQIVGNNVSSRHVAKALGVSHTTVLSKTCGYQLESTS